MADVGTVQWILSTYELPERLEKRLTWIAADRFDELTLTRFDDQYRFIDNLVDKFTRRQWERREVSLDAPAYDDNQRSFQEYVSIARENDQFVVGDGVEADSGTCYDYLPDQRAPPQPAYTDEPDEEPDNARAAEELRTLKMLKNQLEPAYCEFLEYLLGRSRKNGYLREGYVSENLDEIQTRLDEVAGKYRVDGRIVFPPQPILDIRFHPLRIRFGRRPSMTRNPLKYWRRHRHVYQGLRRKELFRVDQSLYQALRAAGQLDEAIPEAYKRRKDKTRR